MTALVPDAAVTAATAALHDEDCCDGDTSTCGRWNSSVPGGYDPRQHIGYYEDRARKVLDASAPHTTAAVRMIIASEIVAQEQPCPEPYHDQFPKPSCWQCARNGAFWRAARIARGMGSEPG